MVSILELLEITPKVEEIQEFTATLKNYKLPGEDGIPPEFSSQQIKMKLRR